MAFQIRDLTGEIWIGEREGLFLTCPAASCGKSSPGDDKDDHGKDDDDKKGDHKKGDQKDGGKGKPKYAPPVGLILLQQQLRQSLALGL
ncbi:MAG: hypothetical protein QOJ16_4163 [Acidobacteriota bacterium]|jgi:hypothetical protein|nr:hypothetical protein [Acidobacteriota bacterium]